MSVEPRHSSAENMQPFKSRAAGSARVLHCSWMSEWEQLYEAWPNGWSTHSGDTATSGRKIEEQQGVWERGRLVESWSVLPETETGKGEKQNQGNLISSPSGDSLEERSEWRKVHTRWQMNPLLNHLQWPPKWLCTTGMRLWMWKASQWMMWKIVCLHHRCYQALKGLSPISE